MRELLGILLLLIGVTYAQNNTNSNPWGVYGEVCYIGQPSQYHPEDAMNVPWFTISLDVEPGERWKQVAQIYAPKVRVALGTVRSVLDFLLPGIYESLVKMCGNSINTVAEPYRSEITGFARYAGMEMGEIALLNMFYEIAKGCTSIVAQTPEGKIYHARNQDFGTGFIWNMTTHTWGQTMALKVVSHSVIHLDIVINVNFVQNGQLLFKGVTFAGHMGILTGLRPHGFTLSTNARFGSTRANMVDFFKRHVNGREFLLYADRDVLVNASTYQQAIDFLNTEPLLASGYFIVGGRQPGEGAIVTRGPNGTDHIQYLNTTQPNGWYVLQTNYDWDKKEIYLDSRLGPGNDCMQKMGQKNVGLAGLYQVLSSKPNLNKATVYTSVMQVDDIVLESFIRHCDDPCWFV